eukprot:COSAG05_NODE_11442_length_513_cov_0.830918_1_plen_37_part_10
MTKTYQYDNGEVSVGFFLMGGLVTLDAVTSRPCRDSL